MDNGLRDWEDPRHPNHSSPLPYFVAGLGFVTVVLGILTVLTLNWHERVVVNAFAAGMIQGEENAQAILSHPVCLTKEK